jgi:hypothetical protein
MISANRPVIAASLLMAPAPWMASARAQYSRAALASPTIPDPISVYDNWSAYDELSDNVPLTEALSMDELDNVLRLRKSGVRFDYYAMDAFWFDPDGAYRTWKKPNWPDGPGNWIKRCQKMVCVPVFGSAPTHWSTSMPRRSGATRSTKWLGDVYVRGRLPSRFHEHSAILARPRNPHIPIRLCGLNCRDAAVGSNVQHGRNHQAQLDRFEGRAGRIPPQKPRRRPGGLQRLRR